MTFTLGNLLDLTANSLRDTNWGSEDKAYKIVVMVCGRTGDGEDFWSFIAMPPSSYLEFSLIHQGGENYSLEKYGEVIAKGWGNTPPQEVRGEIEQTYNLDNEHILEDAIKSDLLPALQQSLDFIVQENA